MRDSEHARSGNGQTDAGGHADMCNSLRERALTPRRLRSLARHAAGGGTIYGACCWAARVVYSFRPTMDELTISLLRPTSQVSNAIRFVCVLSLWSFSSAQIGSWRSSSLASSIARHTLQVRLHQ